MSHKVAKYEASGNDFLIVEHDSLFASPEWAIALCDRKRGVGADGILVVKRNGNGAVMVIYNADGTRPEMCGNGVRCVSAYLEEQEGRAIFPIEILSDAGPKRVERADFKEDSGRHYGVSMGKPIIQPPVTVSYNGTDRLLYRVNMGNPHAISFDEDLFNDHDLHTLGAILNRNHHTFPDGVNLEIVKLSDGLAPVTCRVYERGVGETLACGTGACAVAVALIETKQIESLSVDVALPGGALRIEAPRDKQAQYGSILMTGPASFIAEITMSDAWIQQTLISQENK